MKTLKSILIASTVTLFLASCGDKPKQETHQETDTVTVEHHHNNHDSGALELDNGERWVVNSEMKPHLFESEELLNHYLDSGSSDYQTLAAELKEKNTALIKSCTMEGKSHDELHKWLHPHIVLLEELSQANSEEEANRLVSELQESFAIYHEYFQ